MTILGPDEVAWVRDVTRGGTFEAPPATLCDLVAEQAARTPDHVAVVYEGRHYTYRDIDTAANRVAHWLAYKGVGLEDRVAVLLDKSPELVITALGILRAGAVYLPLEGRVPEIETGLIWRERSDNAVLPRFLEVAGETVPSPMTA